MFVSIFTFVCHSIQQDLEVKLKYNFPAIVRGQLSYSIYADKQQTEEKQIFLSCPPMDEQSFMMQNLHSSCE
jgi:hypothetical protein